MIAIIDNYDSFTYNLAHYAGYFSRRVTVLRNDAFKPESLEKFDKIILSPGPGMPGDVPVLEKVIGMYAAKKPILGVCLGMQAMACAFGGKLYNLPQVMHGIKTTCTFDSDDPLFEGIEPPFEIGHYHSWVIDKNYKPEGFDIIAKGWNDLIMAVKHREYPLYGVQFHPESVLTPQGLKLIGNWCKM